jgi:integrase
MRWVDIDLMRGWWTIPSTSSKNRLAHRVPLNASALEILKVLRADADRRAEAREEAGKRVEEPVFVLEGARGKRQQAVAASRFSVTNFKGHDLRRTAASCMASSGISRLTIGKVLNHVETRSHGRYTIDIATIRRNVPL